MSDIHMWVLHPVILKSLRRIVDGRAPTNEFERGFLEASRAVLVQAAALERPSIEAGQAQPMVYGTVYRSGEPTDNFYDSPEAAQVEVDWMQEHREKVHIRAYSVYDMNTATGRWRDGVDDTVDRLHKRGNGVDY